MPDFRIAKTDRRMSGASGVEEWTGYVTKAVASHAHLGRKKAIPAAARDLKCTPRRVLAGLHREVSRIWLDEMDNARAWYRGWVAAEERRAVHRAAMLAATRAELDAQDARDGIT